MKIDLSKSLFILPNLFTLSSVLCGYCAILICSNQPTGNDFYNAALLIIIAMFLDTIDGRVARLTRTQSAIGVQLDSLADLISFGVAPAILVYQWSLQDLGEIGLIAGFIYIACGAIRLARFNVTTTDDVGEPEKPGKYIQGLPIPAAAGILISLVVAEKFTGNIPFSPVIIGSVVLALSVFMVSSIPFRSFKDLKLTARTVLMILFAFAITVFVAIRFHPSLALVWLLVSYVIIGLIEGTLRFLSRSRRPDYSKS